MANAMVIVKMAKVRLDLQMSPDEDEGASAWTFLWVLFLFKIVTTVIIFWEMRTWIAGFVLGANTWYWFPVMGAMGVAPLMLRRRLRQQRARRLELIRSEWMIEPDGDDRSLPPMLREEPFRR